MISDILNGPLTLKGVLFLIFLYLIKEIIVVGSKWFVNITKIKNETQVKFGEKLLEQKAPVYMNHFSELKKAIGIYKYITENYIIFENWDEDVYKALFNSSNYSSERLDEAYRYILGYRFNSNIKHYVEEFDKRLNDASNEFSLNQLYIPDALIEKFSEIKQESIEKIEKLKEHINQLVESHEVDEEKFRESYEKLLNNSKDISYIMRVEQYLDYLKQVFYREYNVEFQQELIRSHSRLIKK